MNRKKMVDIMICCIAAAVFLLSGIYIKQREVSRILCITCALLFLIFLILAVMDSDGRRYLRRRNRLRGPVREILLLDEEGNGVTDWNIDGKTAVLIGRDNEKEGVDINLQNTAYGGTVSRQHAVLNFAGGEWYVEDLNSENGVRIQTGGEGQSGQVVSGCPCKITRGDILYIGKARLQVR